MLGHTIERLLCLFLISRRAEACSRRMAYFRTISRFLRGNSKI